MNKRNILLVGFLVVFFGTAFFQYKNTASTQKEETKTMIGIKQSVIVEGTKKQVTLRVQKGTTALQLLRSSHTVVMNGEKENAFVTAIDGRAALSEKNEFWSFYVNGKQAQVGAGGYFVKNNDTIEWKIETF